MMHPIQSNYGPFSRTNNFFDQVGLEDDYGLGEPHGEPHGNIVRHGLNEMLQGRELDESPRNRLQ